MCLCTYSFGNICSLFFCHFGTFVTRFIQHLSESIQVTIYDVFVFYQKSTTLLLYSICSDYDVFPYDKTTKQTVKSFWVSEVDLLNKKICMPPRPLSNENIFYPRILVFNFKNLMNEASEILRELQSLLDTVYKKKMKKKQN